MNNDDIIRGLLELVADIDLDTDAVSKSTDFAARFNELARAAQENGMEMPPMVEGLLALTEPLGPSI